MGLRAFFLSSIILERSFTWLGTASAALWVPTSLLSLVAVKHIGISVGQSIWAGVTVIVSFIWGVALFQESPSQIGLAILGLILILIGIVGLSVCNSDKVKSLGRETKVQEQPLLRDMSDKAIEDTGSTSTKKVFLVGLVAAIGTGLTNGSMLVPAKYAAKLDTCHNAYRHLLSLLVFFFFFLSHHSVLKISGQGFIVSFGIGVAIVTSVLAVLFYIVTRKRPVLKPSSMALPAMVSGVMWSIGNYGSIFAAQYLGLAVGFSLTQTALLVGGIWGLTLLKEIRGFLPITIWCVSAAILLAGSAILAIYG
jgi:glucose uptake protein GlcU